MKNKIKKILKSEITWIILIGLILRFFKYTSQSIWLDEAISIFIGKQPLNFIMNYPDPTPPLFYITLHFWMKLSQTEYFIKILNIIFSTITIYITYLISKKLYNKKIGLIASLLIAISPINIFYAQEIRAYSLLILISSILIYNYLKFEETKKNKIYYGITFLAIIYTHIYGVFLIIAIQIHKLISNKESFKLKSKWIKTHIILGILSIPWIIWLIKIIRLGEASWIREPNFKTLIFTIFQSIQGPSSFVIGTLAIIISIALIIISLTEKKQRLEYYWILIPLVIPFTLSFILRPFFYPRYMIFISIPLLILVAVGLTRIKNKKVSRNILIILVILMISTSILQSFSTTKDPWEKITLDKPVLFIPYYEAFPYIYLRETKCFEEKTIKEIYECAENKNIYSINENKILNKSENLTIVVFEHLLDTKNKQFYSNLKQNNNSKKCYNLNTDVGILKNKASYKSFCVIETN